MIWFILSLSVFFGVAFAEDACDCRFMQQAHSDCRFMQQAYNRADQKSENLRRAESTLQLVRSDDIGNVFFTQEPHPLDADVDFNRATTLLMAEQFYLASHGARSPLNQQAHCIRHDKRCSTVPMECRPKNPKFRCMTGAWNNRRYPKWGKSFTPYGYLQPANFADGISEIRKSVVGQTDLPGARAATNAINKDPFTCIPEFPANFGSVMFGQLVAHDHGGRLMRQLRKGGPTRTCCNRDYSKPLSPQPFACHAFEYTKDDPYLNAASPNCSIGCSNFIRSQTTLPNNCSLGSAQAVNTVSHYLDLSPVYGNTVETAKALRTHKHGLLKNNKNKVFPETCNDTTKDCYLTGDMRGTGFFVLGIIQSMYHRFHNIVAHQLMDLNRKWDDERIYQESRRIVIGCYQSHVMDWLRVFVGNEETKQFRPVGNEYLGTYDPSLDASSTVEFSHCAFRVYHSNLADQFRFINANNSVIKTMALDECDIGLKPLETHYDDIARGMLTVPAGHASFTPIVRNKMFNNGNKFGLGIDLIATDLYIGRDLGLQPYHVYFTACTGHVVESWDDLNVTIPAAAIADLKGVYKSVFDVDAYAGVALEAKCGSYLGTVGKWMVVSQYKRTVKGDRFFYSLSDGAYPFTKPQLEQIYNFTYGDLICTVTDLDQIPTRAFEFPGRRNPMVACQRGIDLSAWKDVGDLSYWEDVFEDLNISISA